MNCPICNQKGLNDLAIRCSHCESDLTVLHQVSDIQEKYVANAKQRAYLEGEMQTYKVNAKENINSWKKKSNRYLALFLLLPLIYKFCFMPTSHPEVEKIAKELAIKDSINQYNLKQLESQVVDLQQDTAALSATVKKKIVYKLTKGETLAELGIRFFNDRKAGFRIARDNRLSVDEYKVLPIGQTLIINFR